MAITIRVTPETLKSKAGEISGEIREIEGAISTIGNQISSSKNYWEGDASTTHQKKYKELETSLSSVIKDLKANPRNLLQMAGLYTQTEQELQQTAQSLPTDVIN